MRTEPEAVRPLLAAVQCTERIRPRMQRLHADGLDVLALADGARRARRGAR